MRRREFGRGLLGIAGLASVGGVSNDLELGGRAEARTGVQSDRIGQMLFGSSGGLLDASGQPLTDDSLVAVWAESTAEINDRDGNGDAVDYPDDADIPVAGVDDSSAGTVAAVGAPLVDDGGLVPELEGEDPLGDIGNEEFLLNLYDQYADSGTILWEEGHGQFYSLDSFRNFEAYVEDNGYTVEPTTDVTSDLSGAGAVVITSPSSSFSDPELSAVSDFVDNGGLVVLHHQSDFSDFDETAHSNDVLEAVGAGFRFNDAEVGDEERNVGIYYLPLTRNFNDDEFQLFEDREGITIDLQAGQEYDVTVEDVADGDTVDVVFDGDRIGLETDYTGTVRVLGIDTPESASVAATAERPEEWEGLAYDLGGTDPIDELVFDSTSSLLDADGDPATDGSIGVVFSEPAATNGDADENGDAVDYPDDAEIPLVAVDGTVAGFGAPFVGEGFDSTADNEEFLLNLYDSLVDGGTVLWDEGHDQFYDLASFPEFESYAEENGYDLQATTDLEADLSAADGVVITSPSGFSDSELSALNSFVQGGGAVILHDQSDFNDFDQTANLNEIAAAIGAGFRFNDDQVFDDSNNTGQPFVPVTGNFDSSAALFDERSGIDDGDNPRTTDHLVEWAQNATDFAQRLDGEEVTLFFDENEPLRDPTRLLAFIRYDDTGDGQRDTLYNKQVIEEGYARAYGSTTDRHDEFWAAERTARDQDIGVWSESDLADASPYRDSGLEEVYMPETASVTAGGVGLVNQYATLYAESTASQSGAGIPPLGGIALFGRDDQRGTAVGGGLLIDESYEPLEGFDVDTTGYDNFSFLTTIIESLTDRSGPVYVDGGHGQFGSDYALSSEDMAYYQRHLEGRGINLEQINDLTLDRLGDARALIITTPASALSNAELAAVESFRDAGGAVVLLGSAKAPDSATENLNQVAAALGTQLRVTTDQVLDDTNNVGGDSALPTTTRVSLVEKYTDENGEVSLEALREAIDDWGDGEITTRLLREVIAIWRQSR